MKRILTVLMCALLCIGLLACGQQGTGVSDLWATALYTEDTELGAGGKTVTVEVTVEEKTVVFTLHTDAQMLGEALVEHKLVAGEKGPYGLYVKFVNGIEADYSKTQTYWALNQDGVSLQTGVDATPLSDGARYELVYTK